MKANYDAGLCSHFTISRLSGAPARADARRRLRRRTGSSACSVPKSASACPRPLSTTTARARSKWCSRRDCSSARRPRRRHVRARPPDGDGLTDTRTFLFNRTVRAEFFDGVSKTMHTREFRDEAAFCVQLLRASFASECWERLD